MDVIMRADPMTMLREIPCLKKTYPSMAEDIGSRESIMEALVAPIRRMAL